MLGYMIWYNIFKILEILDMILYPILAKISISYLCLSWSFMRSCVNQSQWIFWWFYAIFLLYMLSSILCDIWTSQFINFLGNVMMFYAAKFQNCYVTLFLPYTESTAKALIIIPNTAFARYFEDILTPKKIWI